mgnify:CR=1 FL=1
MELVLDKIGKISKKLIELGYKRQNFVKPNEADFKAYNEIDFICQITNIFGDSIKAKELSDEYSKTLLNDLIPDISFNNNHFELELYIKKDLIKVIIYRDNKINKFGLESEEMLPFKSISIDGFYVLFVDKNYDIQTILNSGSN